MYTTYTHTSREPLVLSSPDDDGEQHDDARGARGGRRVTRAVHLYQTVGAPLRSNSRRSSSAFWCTGARFAARRNSGPYASARPGASFDAISNSPTARWAVFSWTSALPRLKYASALNGALPSTAGTISSNAYATNVQCIGVRT